MAQDRRYGPAGGGGGRWEAGRILRGKHRPFFTPHVDTGEHVIIVNADKAVLTGNKADEQGLPPQ